VNNGNGTWTYTPALNDFTAVSFSYTITDGSLSAAAARRWTHPGQRCTGHDPGHPRRDRRGQRCPLITQAQLLANASDVDGPSLTATGLAISSGSGTL